MDRPIPRRRDQPILAQSKQVIIVENNYSGQFARYLRSETGFDAHGHIRKYDGEPFMPHHIVEAVKEQLAGKPGSPCQSTKCLHDLGLWISD